jgi:hypothetical protein
VTGPEPGIQLSYYCARCGTYALLDIVTRWCAACTGQRETARAVP